jgi:hypothetical protein
MGLCPICGRYLCDHTEAERARAGEEMGAMMRPLTPEEQERKRLNDNEDWIDTLIRNPGLAKHLDWEKMGNKIEGRTRTLERLANGTLKLHNRN